MGMSRLKSVSCSALVFGECFLTAALKQQVLDLRNNNAYLFTSFAFLLFLPLRVIQPCNCNLI